MAKQHTFKTTKSTEWMDGILDAKAGADKSEFIRDMIVLGLSQIGVHPPTMQEKYGGVVTPTVTPVTQQVLQMVTPKVTQRQEVTPDEDPFLTNNLAKIVPDEPPTIEIKTVELSDDDLEAKLNALDFS